jgi:3-oxoacyl-[acyl-carrier-protein] synthase-3
MIRSVLLGCGSGLPDQIVTNRDLAQRLDTSDEWIIQRTGISQRRIAAAGQTTADLAVMAAKMALDHAGLSADMIDGIIVATSTPDNTFPATAGKVQAMLGLGGHGFAFDINAVCSGFIYALSVADSMIRGGQAKHLLVIGAETYSRILDWQDRSTCVLFGDGAGAVVLGAGQGDGTVTDRGVLSTHLHAEGQHRDMLYVDGGPSSTGTVGKIKMNGREVFRHAVQRLAEVADEILCHHGLETDAIDWLVPHQANRRIIEATARKLNMPDDRVVITVDRHANTASASIPLALSEAVHDGRIKRGDLLLLEAMGGGFTWGGALVRW